MAIDAFFETVADEWAPGYCDRLEQGFTVDSAESLLQIMQEFNIVETEVSGRNVFFKVREYRDNWPLKGYIKNVGNNEMEYWE